MEGERFHGWGSPSDDRIEHDLKYFTESSLRFVNWRYDPQCTLGILRQVR